MKLKEIRRDIILLSILFLLSFALRLIYFQGFILCDDPEEFGHPKYFLEHKPSFNYHFHFRFSIWIFNWFFFKIFGISEMSFFLPTLLMSSTFPLFAFLILRNFKYNSLSSFLAGLVISTAPFEVMIGTLRANDLIFAWFVHLAFTVFVLFRKKQKIQGILVGIFLWLAFYAKMWAAYFYLIFFIFYIYLHRKGENCSGLMYFIASSFILHLITMFYWKKEAGIFLPFFKYHSATYPVTLDNLINIWLTYPTYIFKGSPLGTTLFGTIPYILLLSLIIKFVVSRRKNTKVRFDQLDVFLFTLYFIFFILLNFVPDTPLKFDSYYSVPRIFRYLYPVSFPMTLHLAKNIIDVAFCFRFKRLFLVFIFALLILINILQARESTLYGREYRSNLLSIIEDIKNLRPPTVLVESWVGYFLQEVYLKDFNISIEPIYGIYDAKDYEMWLKNNEERLPNGAALIANFGSCVYYGCYHCGFQIDLFIEKLSDDWNLIKEYEYLKYRNQKPRLYLLSKK